MKRLIGLYCMNVFLIECKINIFLLNLIPKNAIKRKLIIILTPLEHFHFGKYY